MPYATVRQGLKLYYDDRGTGLPIVFVHPPGLGHLVFRCQEPLTRHFRVIRYDVRGHGYSQFLQERFTIEDLSDDLKGLLDALEIEKAVIVGYSSGGSIVQDFMLRYPSRVAGIVLSGGFPEVTDLVLKKEYEIGMTLLRRGHAPFLASVLARTHQLTKRDGRLLKAYVLKSDTRVWHDFYLASYHYKCTDALSSFKKPLLLLSGNLSFYFHHYMTMYHARMPDVQSVIIGNTLHQLPVYKADTFNHTISQFIKKRLV